ncbi:MAG: EAL domain-containing protein [Gammaproteobacteria bacterium]|nr:EAL domain-containing protein [Gammaproteobacteria bacterium]
MQDDVLASIDLDRYFRLMEKLAPEASTFGVCHCSGDCTVAPTKCSNASGSCREYTSTHVNELRDDAATPATCHLAGKENATCSVMIKNRMGDTVGFLLARFTAASFDAADEDEITEKLSYVAACLQEEYLLTKEMNSMARELTGRYEELNLVYDTKDELDHFSQDGDLLQSVVTNCVVYLDVDMVALILPRQERHFYAINRNTHTPDADRLVESLHANFYDHLKYGREHIILNDVNSTQHRSLCPDIPYKVLATPVLNADSRVIGMLACLNHSHRPDFFNSGRSVLEVMSKKVSKIILTNYDNLTGLLSGRIFEVIIGRSLDMARLTGHPSCLLNIDLDQLKVVNDSFGREAGDAAIRQLGEIIKGKLRTSDTIAYLGEGRFGVLIDKSTISQGITVAETLRKLIEKSDINWKSNTIELSASIGLALIDPAIPDTDTALEAAELARETAKESGRNRIHVYHPDDKDIMERKGQMRWVNRIQNALRDDRFIIYCQQIQPLMDQVENYHFEILLRMIDEEGNIVAPDNFIPPAELYHLMTGIDQWVIMNTFMLLAEHGIAQTPDEGCVSINLCGQSLADREIVNRISKHMHQYGIEPSCICFEVTETTAIRNLDAARHIIRELSSIGCRFSLDDFGTGMSSFSYLKELPVNYLKIDGSFVRKITEDQVARAMVSSINDIGHVMGLKTIAEFVENEAILRTIEIIGTDYAQGYVIMKPTPLKDYLQARLKGRNSLQAG